MLEDTNSFCRSSESPFLGRRRPWASSSAPRRRLDGHGVRSGGGNERGERDELAGVLTGGRGGLQQSEKEVVDSAVLLFATAAPALYLTGCRGPKAMSETRKRERGRDGMAVAELTDGGGGR